MWIKWNVSRPGCWYSCGGHLTWNKTSAQTPVPPPPPGTLVPPGRWYENGWELLVFCNIYSDFISIQTNRISLFCLNICNMFGVNDSSFELQHHKKYCLCILYLYAFHSSLSHTIKIQMLSKQNAIINTHILLLTCHFVLSVHHFTGTFT